jgi:hypothetical protein
MAAEVSAVRSYLASIVPSTPTTPEQLEQLRARAWSEQGVVVLAVAEITDDFVRQALLNEATRRWGRRMRR